MLPTSPSLHIESHGWWSPHLGRDMELKLYGHAGKAALVFPTQGGRFYEYEDFGMVEACRPWLEAGKLRLFCVDSVDKESWANAGLHPAERARRHEAYDAYVYAEVVPFIRKRTGPDLPLLTTGCSLGAYHAANFFFRHPNVGDAVIALSGLMRLNHFIGDYMDDLVYFHTPLAYLPNLEDPWYLERYRRSRIIVCAGQGAWEGPMIEDARALQRILAAKGVPCWVDLWGQDVNHDWPWWRKMMPYFLGKIIG